MLGVNAWIKSPVGNSYSTPSLQERRSTSTGSRLSVSTGEDSKEPRVVGWKGETVKDFHPCSIDVTEYAAPSPLDSTSSFQNGKTFWMRFLQDKDAPSFSPSTESEGSASYYQEIKRTGTSVSSLTGYSGFKRISAPAALTIPLDTPTNSISTCSLDDRPSSAKSLNGKKKLSPVAYPLGTLPMKSPRLGAVPMKKSFVLPQEIRGTNDSKVMTPQSSPPLIEHHLSVSRTTKTSEGDENANEFWLPKSSPTPNDQFDRAYAVWERTGLMKNRVGGESTAMANSFVDTSLFPKDAQNVSSHRFATSSQVVKQIPGSGDVDPYEIWRRVGLMKSGTKSTTSSSQKLKPTTLSSANPSRQHFAEQKTAEKTRRKSTHDFMQLHGENPHQVWQRAGLMKNSTVQTTTPPPTRGLKVKPSPKESHSGNSVGANEDSVEFQNILKQWRNKGDDTPSSHLLSPVPKGQGASLVKARAKSMSVSVVEKENQKNTPPPSYHSRAPATIVDVQERDDEASTIDFFDQMREKLSPRENRDSENQFQRQSRYSFQASPRENSEKTDAFSSNSNFERKVKVPGEEQLLERAGSFERKNHSPRRKPSAQSNLDPFQKAANVSKTENLLKSLGGNRAIVLLERDNRYEVLVGQVQSSSDQQLILQSVELVSSEQSMGDNDSPVAANPTCRCSQSIFSGNDDLINFFLPQMGMACTCQQQQWGFAKPDDPTAIENVLRPWQVKFLHRFGILHADQLVKARHRSAGILAKAMRQWRTKEGLLAFRTSSCMMAIDIWAKTCKAYVRSVRKQMGGEGGEGASLARGLPEALIPELSNYVNNLPQAQTPRDSSNAYGVIKHFEVEV